jgi:acid phosphatase (class A)
MNLDGAMIVGPPPTPDSPRGKADRAAFEATRKLAGTPAWDKAIADADLSGAHGFKSFSCAAGVTIGPEATPTWPTCCCG